MWMLSYKFSSYRNKLVRAFCNTVKQNSSNDIKLNTITQRSWPGLASPCKLWWAKEITSDLHVAGGLTNRQFKYAYDSGFKSIVSLYKENKPGNFGGEELATKSEIESIQKLTGIQFETVLEQDDNYLSLDSISKLSKCISKVQKPTLLYSQEPDEIAFSTLLHMACESRRDPQYQPRVDSAKIYKMATVMGMDFTSATKKALISEITGEPVFKNPPKPNAFPTNWYGYWLPHPVYKNWFSAGQIRKGHLKEIESAGFKSVINMRLGMTYEGKPSQEPVTLINVKDFLNTYDDDLRPIRQVDNILRENVIDPSLESTYISQTSNKNYESRNVGEYGDDIGHNEEIEREHFKETKLNYHHIPIDMKLNADVFKQHQDVLSDIGKEGPVLVHCTVGARAAFMSVLAAALQYNKDFDWALQRTNELGFDVTTDKLFTEVYGMYKDVLRPGQ